MKKAKKSLPDKPRKPILHELLNLFIPEQDIEIHSLKSKQLEYSGTAYECPDTWDAYPVNSIVAYGGNGSLITIIIDEDELI